MVKVEGAAADGDHGRVPVVISGIESIPDDSDTITDSGKNGIITPRVPGGDAVVPVARGVKGLVPAPSHRLAAIKKSVCVKERTVSS